MSERTNRLTEELYWVSYKELYYIGLRETEELVRDNAGNIVFDENGKERTVRIKRNVNELQEAIDSGEFEAKIQKCADMLHDGDVEEVYFAMAKNLDSQRFHMKKRDVAVSASDKIRFATIDAFVRGHRASGNENTEEIPQWAFGPEQIDKIDDPAKLLKIINSISDVASDSKFNKAYAVRLGENYREAAKANRTYARKRKAMLETQAKVKLPETLIAKIQSGDKAQFTAEEMVLLAEFLKQK